MLLGPEVGYIDLLDFHLTEKLKNESAAGRKYNPLRPSSAGKCSRELAYEMAEYRGIATYEKEPMSPDTHRLLNLGHSIEWNILKMFEDVEMFDVKYRQQVVSFFKLENEDKWIEGSVDAVIWSPKHKAVIDIKSKKNNFSSWGSSQWDEHSEKYSKLQSVQKITERAFWIEDLEAFIEEINDPFLAANFYQLNLYACTEFMVERGVDHAAVVQYNKNDSRLRELRFKPSRAVYEATRSKFQSVASVVEGSEGPEKIRRDYALGSIKCAFCSFRSTCWPQDDALKEYFKTWPKKAWPDKTASLGEVGSELEDLFARYTQTENAEKEKARIESLITLVMNENEIQKVELSDGRVYEMKALKTGLVVRRAKK